MKVLFAGNGNPVRLEVISRSISSFGDSVGDCKSENKKGLQNYSQPLEITWRPQPDSNRCCRRERPIFIFFSKIHYNPLFSITKYNQIVVVSIDIHHFSL